MSEIHPVNSSNPLPRVNSQPATPRPSSNGVHRSGADSVEVSEMATWLAKLDELPETREDLVSSVRSEIDAGNYLTDSKLEGALDGLLGDLQA